MSDVCRVYEAAVLAPVEIALSIEMTDGGMIDHISGETYDDIPPVDELRVIRAVRFLTDIIQGLQTRGDLVVDAVKHLPDSPEFAVERSILAAVAEVQTQVLAQHITKRGRAA